jgi:hypothetical protein
MRTNVEKMMSDTDRPALERAPQLIAHRCHCGSYGGFGFTRPGRHSKMEWWCWEHYPYRNPDARIEAGMVAELMAS